MTSRDRVLLSSYLIIFSLSVCIKKNTSFLSTLSQDLTSFSFFSKYITKASCYPEFPLTYTTFNTDGSYYGSGVFGTGSGKYKAQDYIIICYVDGSEYARYHILNLSSTQCELKMNKNNESVNY